MILHIILFILLFFFVIVIVGFSVLFKFLKMLGIGRKTDRRYYENTRTSGETKEDSSFSEPIKRKSAEKKKVFDKTEGEYIDFEDV